LINGVGAKLKLMNEFVGMIKFLSIKKVVGKLLAEGKRLVKLVDEGQTRIKAKMG